MSELIDLLKTKMGNSPFPVCAARTWEWSIESKKKKRRKD